MKKTLLLLSFIPLFIEAQTGDKTFINQNYIEVIGKSEMEIAPLLIKCLSFFVFCTLIDLGDSHK
jgi:hypothetical protein